MAFVLDCSSVPEIITLYQAYGTVVLDIALYIIIIIKKDAKSNRIQLWKTKFNDNGKKLMNHVVAGVRTLVRPDISSNQQKVELVSARTKVRQLF